MPNRALRLSVLGLTAGLMRAAPATPTDPIQGLGQPMQIALLLGA